MTLSRVYVGEDVDQRLRNLKARTGLTPNLLCRLGFCLSLAEPGIPDPQLYADGQAREFNRYTLTGQWDLFFFSLLRERLVLDGLDVDHHLEPQFKAHLSRGVLLLYQRLKTLADLGDIVSEAQKRTRDHQMEEEVIVPLPSQSESSPETDVMDIYEYLSKHPDLELLDEEGYVTAAQAAEFLAVRGGFEGQPITVTLDSIEVVSDDGQKFVYGIDQGQAHG